jgi:hypothetical protein
VPPAPFHHARDHQPAQLEGRVEVHGDQGVDILLRVARKREHVLDPRVVHQDVQRTEGGLGVSHHGSLIVFVRDVAGHHGHPVGIQGAADPVQVVGRAGGQGHPPAASLQRPGDVGT